MNKTSVIFLGAFLLIALIMPAQKFLGHNIHFTPKNFPVRNYSESEYREKLQSKYALTIASENERNEFIQTMLAYKKAYLSSNYEYENFQDINAYLQRIADTINVHAGLKITVKVCRDPSVNAQAFEDGTIYMNIGLLQQLETEAQLVAVLGHEITHVANNHAYKYYKSTTRYVSGLYENYYQASFIVALIRTKSFSHQLIGYEEECDQGASRLLTTSGYNPAALSQVFDLFLKDERREEALYGKSFRPLLYVQTHPGSESRLRKAKELCKATGKDFRIDSLKFSELKRIATDETINLHFENLSFINCLELAYSCHLINPNDPFYLFYITECTRRIISLDGKNAGKYFITGSYENDFDFGERPPAKPDQGLAFTNHQYEPQKKDFLKTVFYQFHGFVKRRSGSVPDHELMRNDTLEFVTYRDALEYFKGRNAAFGFKLNNIFLSPHAGEAYQPEKMDFADTSREKYYENLALADAYYKNKSYSINKILLVIYDIDYISYTKEGLNTGEVKTLNNKYHEIVSALKKSSYAVEFCLPDELYFNERNSVSSFLDVVYPMLNKSTFLFGTDRASDQVYFDMNGVMPELTALLLNHNYTGVVFSRIDITEKNITSMLGSGGKSEIWKPKNFYLDVRKGRINYLADVVGSTEYKFLGGSSLGSMGNKNLFEAYFKTLDDTVYK